MTTLRKILPLATLGLTAVALAGCSSTSAAPSSDDAPAEVTRITLYTSEPQ